MGFYTCVQKQLPESDGNNKTTLEKGGRNPPDVTLDDIAKDLLSFFNRFESLRKTKNNIEEKYDIKNEYGDYWSADDIKRAWGKTQRMDKKSDKRKHWAHVIILQMLERFMVYGACKPNAAQEDHDDAANDINQSCETRPGMKENSEDGSAKRKTEPETVGAAEEVEQVSGEGIKLSKVSSLSEDSGVASGSQLSASSTDVAPSPTEVNPIANLSNSGTKNAALMNEDEDTLVNNCEQQTYVDYDQCLADVHDKENARWENGLRSACGISQRMKGNSGEGLTQSNDEPQQTEQTKETAGQQSGADSGASKRKCKDIAGPEDSGERDDSNEVPKRRNLKKNDDGSWTREIANKSNSQTVYIRIPFSVMSGNESPSSIDTVVQNDSPTYKLIDRVPYITEIRKRKSYALLYDNRTKNAAWVYEILNSETLKEEVKRENDKFSVDQSIHPFYQASNKKYTHTYERGHLAAVANHKWCQEALDDTFLMSNISPQHKYMNNGKWKSLETYCRSKVKDNQNEIRNVHVYSGPLYPPTDNSVVEEVNYKEMRGQAVPTHFFKVIIEEYNDGTVKMECYRMPNEGLDYYKVSIEEIERASGLIFRENSCSKGETDSDREITWTGENEHGETCTVKTRVRISTPCS